MQIFGLAALAACLALPAAGQSDPAALASEQWRSDLAALAKELPARHKNAFSRMTRADFEKQVAALDARIPKLSEMEIRTGILKLVAAIGDSHTIVQSWGRLKPFDTVPIGLYWFKDGIFVVTAGESYRNLLGARLMRVGNMSVDEACRVLTVLVPHENDAGVKGLLPNNFLTKPGILRAMGIVGPADTVHLELRSQAGTNIVVDLPALAPEAAAKPVMAFDGDPPLYRSNRSPYWATTIDNGSTVYFQYNSCVNDPKLPFPEFRAKLNEMLRKDSVRRLVVDVRLNGGGNSAILDSWITEFKASPLNKKGSLYVIIGRGTFSSAILNAVRFRNETAATLIGEPTAGKPNHFGEIRSFTLAFSQIQVSYSTKYFRATDDERPSLMPDVLVEQTSGDFLAGRDPVLDVILDRGSR